MENGESVYKFMSKVFQQQRNPLMLFSYNTKKLLLRYVKVILSDSLSPRSLWLFLFLPLIVRLVTMELGNITAVTSIQRALLARDLNSCSVTSIALSLILLLLSFKRWYCIKTVTQLNGTIQTKSALPNNSIKTALSLRPEEITIINIIFSGYLLCKIEIFRSSNA